LRALKMLESRPCAIRDHRTTLPALIWIVVAALVLRLAVCAGGS
jgi:hypothetical protein